MTAGAPIAAFSHRRRSYRTGALCRPRSAALISRSRSAQTNKRQRPRRGEAGSARRQSLARLIRRASVGRRRRIGKGFGPDRRPTAKPTKWRRSEAKLRSAPSGVSPRKRTKDEPGNERARSRREPGQGARIDAPVPVARGYGISKAHGILEKNCTR